MDITDYLKWMELMDVILSVKPIHVKAIQLGRKQYEFRKNIFRKSVDRVYIYATSPVKRIEGYFNVGKIVEDRPTLLWEAFNKYAGVTKSEFFSYYGQRDKGFAIEIKDAVFFTYPLEPRYLPRDFSPPQSFRYISTRDLLQPLNWR
jgi:predicted transcriptional regulator